MVFSLLYRHPERLLHCALIVSVLLVSACQPGSSPAAPIGNSPGQISDSDPLPPAARPTVRGAVIAHVHTMRGGYGSGVTAPLYQRLKAMGVTSVQFNTFAYQRGLKGRQLYWNDPTLSKARLAREIRAARSHGFTVMLKPHIWVGNFNPLGPKVWRNEIDFQDPEERAEWFAEYRRFLLGQAAVARETGAEYFAVGTELVLLSRHEAEWRALIADVRKQYKGQLTYACEAWNAPNIKFWDALDAIGLDMYYEYKDTDAEGKAGEEQLAAFYAERLREHYAHARKLGKPILLTEIGFPSHDLAIRKPYSWSGTKSRPAPELQSLAYRAFGRALQIAGPPRGLYIWKYVTTMDSYERENSVLGFVMEGKPAESEIARIFGGTSPTTSDAKPTASAQAAPVPPDPALTEEPGAAFSDFMKQLREAE